jgi:hypothetical protein
MALSFFSLNFLKTSFSAVLCHLISILTSWNGLSQFSVTEHYTAGDHGPRVVPGVFFFYDLSPIKVPHQSLFEA